MGDAYAWRSRCISLLMMVQTSSALTKRPAYRLNAFSTTLCEFHGAASPALHFGSPVKWLWWFLPILTPIWATHNQLTVPLSCVMMQIIKLCLSSFLCEFWVFRLRVFNILRKHQIMRRMVYVCSLDSQGQSRSQKKHRHQSRSAFLKKKIHGSRSIHGSHLEKVKCETRISLHGFLLIKFHEKCEMRVYIFRWSIWEVRNVKFCVKRELNFWKNGLQFSVGHTPATPSHSCSPSPPPSN